MADFGSSLGQFLGGAFGDSGKPYEKAMDQYRNALGPAQGYQNPFYNAGKGAIGPYQDWLGSMKDPSQFINSLMSHYQESPFARFQQQQGVRAAQNLGSASGLTGSSALSQQAQQNAQNISSQDMQTWLANVLGINTQYGAGQAGLMSGGRHAGDILSQLMNQFGQNMAHAAYGKQAGKNQDRSNMIGGATGMLKNGFFGGGGGGNGFFGGGRGGGGDEFFDY